MADWTELLGLERYAAFEAACPQGASQGVPAPVLLHEHNAAIATSVLRTVALLEVPLRNVLATQLQLIVEASQEPGVAWYEQKLPRCLSNTHANKKLEEAIEQAQRTARAQTRPVRPGDVVAALSLGYWTRLLGQSCDDLWPSGLHQAFAPLGTMVKFDGVESLSHRRYRVWLHQRLERITRIRNRAAHHERVHDADLAKLRRDLISSANAISPALGSRVIQSWDAESIQAASPFEPATQ